MSRPLIGVTGYADRSARPSNVSLFAVAQTYIDAVSSAGGGPVIIPPHLEIELLEGVLAGLSGLVLSGGGDIHPSFFGEADCGLLWRVDEKRDRGELSLARGALRNELPMLAICRGIQVLNVAAGGTLIQDIPTQRPDGLPHSSVTGQPRATVAHTVDLEAGSRLAHLIGTAECGVNSCHHQAVKDVGHQLRVVAQARDGIIEGLEAADHPFCVGVQWHPEAMVETTPAMRGLFTGLVEAARM